ncbi:uncharacterized protein LOC121142646 isoform X3 [Mesocricetus auratus]|uniref:Uncharacterized protein LOC121142646 isoform X3 n=1 Tax=Mesocricetus auratus TaxID=10036 RepID=A0ABM2Y1E3_MESAU|nr:uncharacterized protein LOC121142646 isoform X3 [Mesocricetus auratus]
MAGAGSNGEALAPRMELIEMKDKLRNRQEIVNGLNIFLEENEEDASLEELEEESDVFEEEETEALSEDGSKEAHDKSVRCMPSYKIVRTSHKVSLRSITSMTDEERFNMRIKKFGINTSKEFRKSPGASWQRKCRYGKEEKATGAFPTPVTCSCIFSPEFICQKSIEEPN